jgi:hypothetical protein
MPDDIRPPRAVTTRQLVLNNATVGDTEGDTYFVTRNWLDTAETLPPGRLMRLGFDLGAGIAAGVAVAGVTVALLLTAGALAWQQVLA